MFYTLVHILFYLILLCSRQTLRILRFLPPTPLCPPSQEWTPTAGPLQPITAYGMRIYRRGASLAFHADRVDTHVVSSIFHIDHSYDHDDEQWPIEIEGHDGLRHSVSLKPGQMLLYESAKCPHGRSTSLKGDW